jgi:hypothetical protein
MINCTRKTVHKLVMSILCLAGMFSSQVKAQSKIIFYDDCEASGRPQNFLGGGQPPTRWSSQQGYSSVGSITRSGEYSRKGGYSYKHILNNSGGNDWASLKAELAWNFLPAGSPLGTVGNTEAFYRKPLGLRWIAASILIPSYNNDFNTVTSLGFNTKCVEDNWPQPTELQMEKGRYVFYLCKVSSTYQTTLVKYDVGPVVKDKWEDWIINRDYTSKSNGFIRLYKNGQLMVEYIGGNWMDDGKHSSEPYVQMGLYKWAFKDGWSPTPDVNTVTMFMDEVRMGGELGTLADFLLDVAPPPVSNQAPVANAGTAKSITLPTNSVALAGSATDADGTVDGYKWTQTAGPNTAVITNGSSASATMSSLIQGTYTFQLTATDNSGATGTSTVNVTVAAAPVANIAPTADAGADKSVTLPTNTVALSGTAADPDGSISKVNWAQTNGPNTALLSAATALATNVSNCVQGTYTFRLTVTDNKGATAASDINVAVVAAGANIPPVAKSGGNLSTTLPDNTVTLNGSGTDADGSVDKYDWIQLTGPNTATIDINNAATTAVAGLIEGVYTFQLTVTDNNGATAKSSATVTVIAAPVANVPPVATSGGNKSITLPINSIVLTGSGTDADGTIKAYAWSQNSGPNTATIANGTTTSATFSNLIAGVYYFKFTVTDNDNATNAITIAVTVSATAAAVKKAPIAKTKGKQSLTGTATTVTGVDSYDPDGTITTYRWTQTKGPNTATMANSDKVDMNLSKLVSGSYTFQLEVTDNDKLTGTATLTLDVSAPVATTAPIANAGTDITVLFPSNSANLDGSASNDPGGSIKTYKWAKITGPGTPTIATSAAAKTLISSLREGVYSFELLITDGEGLTDTDTVMVTVKAQVANKVPVIVTETTMEVLQPVDTVLLDGSKSYDTDGKIVLFQWKMLNGINQPAMAKPNEATTSVSKLEPGTYVFQLTIKDDRGAVVTKEVNVTVKNQKGFVPNSAMKIYPNPVANTFTLRLDDASMGKGTVRIYTITGVVLLTDVIEKTSKTFIKNYSIGNMPGSTYVLTVQFDKQKPTVRKLVKL